QPRFSAFLGELAQGLGQVGQIAAGIATIDDALARCEQNEDRWFIAELLRIKGGLVQRENARDAAAAAEEHFGRSVGWARRAGGAGRVRWPGSWVPRRASPGCGTRMAAQARPATCWRHPTVASPRVSRLPI